MQVSSRPFGQVSGRATSFFKVQSCFPVSIIILTLIQLTVKDFNIIFKYINVMLYEYIVKNTDTNTNPIKKLAEKSLLQNGLLRVIILFVTEEFPRD